MLVVNDKIFRKLTIVMAGVKGVSGHDFEIVTIQFKFVYNLTKTFPGNIDIKEAELVS